jgi:hypothetical protein
MFLIATTTLSANGGISFSNIPQTFTHLQLRVNGRAVNSGYATVYTGFNGDRYAANNYHSTYYYGDGAGTSIASSTNAFTGPFYFIHSGATANTWNGYIMDILNYTDTSRNKTIKYISGWDAIGSGRMAVGSGLWMSTAAITSIDFEPDAGFLAGSTASLYGLYSSSATG